MGEATLGMPADEVGGKAIRLRTAEAGMPASVYEEVGIMSDVYGFVCHQVTGTIGALDAAVTADVALLASSWVIDVRGTFSGTVTFEFSANGTDYGGAVARITGVGGNTDLVTSTTTPGLFRGNSSGMRFLRARMSAYTSGSATIVLRMGAGPGPVFLNASLPPGTDTIGGATHGVATASTIARITAAAADTLVIAANTARRGLMVYNESTAWMYLKYGSAASLTSYSVRLGPNGYWEMPNPVYTGICHAIWTSANGAAQVTELTL